MLATAAAIRAVSTGMRSLSRCRVFQLACSLGLLWRSVFPFMLNKHEVDFVRIASLPGSKVQAAWVSREAAAAWPFGRLHESPQLDGEAFLTLRSLSEPLVGEELGWLRELKTLGYVGFRHG